MKRQWDEDELAEQWTLAPEELALLANKAGPTRLGFAMLLKVFARDGRFPRSRQEIAGAVVVHLAKQVGVSAQQYLRYDWTGRAIKDHRAQIRAFFGFREAALRSGNGSRRGTWSGTPRHLGGHSAGLTARASARALLTPGGYWWCAA